MSKLKHKLDLNTRDYLFVFDDKITLRHCEKTQYDVEINNKDIKNVVIKPASTFSRGTLQFICSDNETEETIQNNTVFFKGNTLNKTLDSIFNADGVIESTVPTSLLTCSICKKPVHGASPYGIVDGNICLDCFNKLNLKNSQGIPLTRNALIERNSFIDKNDKMLSSFNPDTRELGFSMDQASEQFRIQGYPDLIPFSALVNFEYVEDGNIVTSGGLGRAVAGGLLFGATGAIVGGITGGKKSRNTVTNMYIRLTLDYKWFNTAQIVFCEREIKKDSMSYKVNKNSANQVISSLELISNSNSKLQNTAQATPNSIADEILKLKQLLDMGVITQEEFETQKSKILN